MGSPWGTSSVRGDLKCSLNRFFLSRTALLSPALSSLEGRRGRELITLFEECLNCVVHTLARRV
jgi:hypothetical protein